MIHDPPKPCHQDRLMKTEQLRRLKIGSPAVHYSFKKDGDKIPSIAFLSFTLHLGFRLTECNDLSQCLKTSIAHSFTKLAADM